MTLPKLICIVGPTASGKTALGVRLAQEFNGEVISCDSRQMYRGMDIGTAKPYLEYDTIERLRKTVTQKRTEGPWVSSLGDRGKSVLVEGIPHYSVDIVDPDEEYSVADFQSEAFAIISDIIARGRVPFLVGGTGLYIQAVVDNFRIPRIPPDIELRNRLEHLLEQQGIETLYLELLKLDPHAADVVHAKNPRRIIRALEVCIKTGRPFTSLRQRGKKRFHPLLFGINWPREELMKRIAYRTDVMIAGGLVEEVQELQKQYSFQLPAFSSIHYPEIASYVRNEVDLKEATQLINSHDRKFVRKQLVWFRRDERIRWLPPGEIPLKQIKKFLK